MKLSKLILPAIIIVVIAIIYFTYFVPSLKLGSFDKFDGGSEINQQINVGVVRSKDFERDANGGIVSFYAQDKNNLVIKITLHEPAPEEIVNAAVVELMGHLHGNSFVASGVTVVK